MICTYRVRKDDVRDEASKVYTVYGIEAIDSAGKTLLSYPDVFFDLQKAERLADLCNDENLSLIHFPGVIEDALAE